MKKYLLPLRNWYARFERPISSLSLIGGFVFDAITLKRVDQLWENFWVLIHLLVVGILIVLINREENLGTDARDPEKLHFWYINILQFTFGGLLSVFLVFYFRSGSIVSSWPFLLILTLAFIANERLKNHYQRITFQISLFYLSILSFSIFIVPVVVHSIGDGVFILSGLVSLVALWIFLRILRVFAGEKLGSDKSKVALAVVLIFISINVLYFTEILPPIPLSLKDGGIYSTIEKNYGGYLVTGEVEHLSGYLVLYKKVYINAGDTLYVYSAVFSPTNLNTEIMHVWQYRKPDSKEWVTVSTIPLQLLGGRDGGFRTYSSISPAFGTWRVKVLTSTGHTIGTIRFEVIEGNTFKITKFLN